MNSVEIFFLIAGGAFGLLIVIATFMVVLPIYASSGLFVNKPQGLEESGFHLFTLIEPGQVKIIVRGKRPVRMIANISGKMFARDSKNKNATIDDPEYWEIDSGNNNESEDPLAGVWPPIRWWARLVYNQTGLVFSGIYPFQKVREYKLERTTVVRYEENRKQRPDGKQESNICLIVKEDVSDHFRARQFLFPVHVTAAESQDKIPLDIIGVAELEVINPHKAAFGTDRWDHAVTNLITDAIIGVTKKLKLDQVLTFTDKRDAKMLANAITAIRSDQIECGIQIRSFRILEINPVLDAEGFKAIQAEAIALQKAKATRADGDARAAALKAVNEANKVGGEHSVATMEAEALVRAAEAAGKNGGSVILMPGNSKSNVDPTQVAILTELKVLNQTKRSRP